MTSRALVPAFALLLGSLGIAGCDDGGGSGGGGGAGGESGEGGAPDLSVVVGTSATAPSTSSGPPRRSPAQICSDACACDAECVADQANFVASCEARFEDDARVATLTGCSAEQAAYVACFANEWTCGEPDACDDPAEALAVCVATLCEQANSLCGCPGCGGECRDPWERCWSVCIVEAGTCDGDHYECTDACYAQQEGSSSSGTGGSW